MGLQLLRATKTETELALDWRNGDQQAGGVLFELLSGYTLGPMRKRARNQDDAEDLNQDLWLTAFLRIQTWNPDLSTFRTWLRGIARIILLRYMAADPDRQDWYNRTVALEELSEEPEDAEESIAGLIQNRVLWDEVSKRLSPADRQIIQMRILEGHKFAEIAHKLGIKPGAARQRFHRACERARSICEDEGIPDIW
ncbi:MAG: sigma-70 family RNA polymerase sigma factor [Armatimonadetes bacterium]|nr:sigma-70 family RNA polymerase sigma factor [Armatimonadota bacterium]